MPRIVDIIRRDLPALATFDFEGGGFGGTSSYPLALRVLIQNSFATIKLVFLGVICGLLIGIFGGLALSRWRPLRIAIEPIVLVGRTTPLLALVPLFLLWFGGRYVGFVIYMTFAVAAMLIINTIEAVRNISPVYLSFARTLGATENQVFRTIVIPAVVPELVGGIRVVLGLAWAIALGAEFLAAQSGLGRLLILSQNFLYTGRMIIIVGLFGIFAALTNTITLSISNYVTRWKP
jgi:ABC-type nitrate/sulfonate/bicarbonate transport system permease component